MSHLNEGVLRRMLDEPFSASSSSRSHLADCVVCQRSMHEIKSDASLTDGLLSSGRVGGPTPAPALQQFKNKMQAGNLRPASPWRSFISARALGYRNRSQAVAVTGLAAALVASLALTPAGSFAQSFITIFQAKNVAAVSITAADLQSLPNLNRFGTTHLSAQPKPVDAATLAVAQTAAAYKVLSPAALPPDTPNSVKYTVLPGETGTFTFSADKASRAEAGKKVASMPSGINGSTLKIQLGAAVLSVYGNASGALPPLVVGQMRSPRVSSTGVSVRQIEDYVLSLPGVSARLAASIRTISDPTSTLPIPIPIDRASSQSVTVQGAHGLLIGDSTGIGSAVIWQKNGMIYSVGGAQSESAILTAANSLH